MHSPFRHIPSIFIKNRPIHLTFFVTKRCNARCPFCFYLKSTTTDTKGQELSLDEIEKVSSSLGTLLWLAFSGGEIFLRDDLSAISRIFYNRNRPAIMLFPTNGILTGRIHDTIEEILSASPKSIIALKLSIDGLGEDHDRLRNTPDNFARTMQTYDRLKPLLRRYPNFELGVNTVFCSENQDAMDSIIDFVAGLDGIRTHTISLVRGDLSQPGYKEVDTAKYRHAICRLEENLKAGSGATYRFRGGRVKAAQDILQRTLICRTLEEGSMQIPCFAGRLNLVLTEDGRVFPCEILKRELGNVRDYGYDLRRVLSAPEAQRVIRHIRDRRCVCTHECYYMTNILFNPRCYAALANEYLQLSRTGR